MVDQRQAFRTVKEKTKAYRYKFELPCTTAWCRRVEILGLSIVGFFDGVDVDVVRAVRAYLVYEVLDYQLLPPSASYGRRR